MLQQSAPHNIGRIASALSLKKLLWRSPVSCRRVGVSSVHVRETALRMLSPANCSTQNSTYMVLQGLCTFYRSDLSISEHWVSNLCIKCSLTCWKLLYLLWLVFRDYIQALYRHGGLVSTGAQRKCHPQLLPWKWNQDHIQVVQRRKATDQCNKAAVLPWPQTLDYHTGVDGRWWHLQLHSGESCGQGDKPAYQIDCLQ